MNAPPVQYATTPDGYSIAYTVSGAGPQLLFTPAGMTHVQLSWNGTFGTWFEKLSARFQLVTYDTRGFGLSGRGLGPEFKSSDLELDLEAVLNNLAPDPVVLLAAGGTSHAGIAYAVSHPGRVQALVLLNATVRNRRRPSVLTLSLAQQNWELFLRQHARDRGATVDDVRQMVTQDDWLTFTSIMTSPDASAVLPRLTTPTLVLHVRGSLNVDSTLASELASLIPKSRLTSIDGVPDTPFGDAEQGVEAITAFLHTLPATHDLDGLSGREVEVLCLLAAGKSNQQIADALVISRNTVRRHVSNIFDKTSVANRAQAGAYARDRGLA